MAKAELGGVEVKKKRYLVMTVAAVLIMAAVAASAYVLQKKRETPEDRALRKSSEAHLKRQTAKLRETRPERK